MTEYLNASLFIAVSVMSIVYARRLVQQHRTFWAAMGILWFGLHRLTVAAAWVVRGIEGEPTEFTLTARDSIWIGTVGLLVFFISEVRYWDRVKGIEADLIERLRTARENGH